MIYPAHLNRDVTEEYNTPYLHWVMMGLKGDGGYNSEDYAFTRSFTDLKERDAALVEEVKQRLKVLGPSGLYKLFWRKTVRTFGSGTYNQSDFLDDNPEQLTWLHSLLLGSGKDYPVYRAVCQVIFFAILALMALSGLQEVLGRKQKEPLVRGIKGLKGGAEAEPVKGPAWCCMAPQAAVFGVMLFFSGWETSGRPYGTVQRGWEPHGAVGADLF